MIVRLQGAAAQGPRRLSGLAVLLGDRKQKCSMMCGFMVTSICFILSFCNGCSLVMYYIIDQATISIVISVGWGYLFV